MVGFAVVFIVCFIIQLFIWHSFISNQLQKHHIRKSDIKKLISNLCGGNYNEFSHYCRHISTGGSLLLVIATLIIFPLVMTVVIDAAIETHSWLILIVFSIVGFGGINIAIFKRYGAHIELCLNELISYIGIINSCESNYQSKRNIIMIHNTNDKSQTKTKADWLLWVTVVIIIIGVILMLRIDLGNVFLSNGSLPGTSIKEYIHISPFFILGLILLNVYSAVNGKKTDLDKAKSTLAGKIGQKSKDINIVINNNIFHYNSSKYKQYIIDICLKYRLKNLVIATDVGFNAHATLIDNVPHIFVGTDLAEQFDDGSILFVIGHEIGHIYYGDLKNRDHHSLIKLTLIIFVVLFLFTRMINFFSPRIAFYIAAIVLLLLIYIDRVFYMSYDNEYYCKQIRELRADRFGFNVLNSYVNDADKSVGILKNEIVNDEPTEPTTVPFFEALLIRLKILPALEDCHPSWKFRVDEIERNKSRTKWGLIDDMYYTWKFSFGIMFSNRWRLK